MRDSHTRAGKKIGGNRRAASSPSEEFGSFATTRIPGTPSSFLVPGILARRLGELSSGSEETAHRSWFHLRHILEELGTLILSSGAAEESILAAAHAPFPRGCGHIPQPRASIMHGRTCSRDPRARLAYRPPPRPQRPRAPVWMRLGRRNCGGCCASVSSGVRCSLKMKCADLDKVRKKTGFFFFFLTPDSKRLCLVQSSCPVVPPKSKTVLVQTWIRRAGTKFAKH